MRLLATISAATILCSSCGSEHADHSTQQSLSSKIAVRPVDSVKTADQIKHSETFKPVAPESLLESFIYCRENAENSFTCKYFIARAIHQFYGVDDFMTSDGNYLDYELIRPAIESSAQWTRIGEAGKQEVLIAAQEKANDGHAVLGISEQDKYGHIVLILPGKLKHAANWNLNCPDVASFFMIKGITPYVNKSMAYSWSSPAGIGIYVRD